MAELTEDQIVTELEDRVDRDPMATWALDAIRAEVPAREVWEQYVSWATMADERKHQWRT